MQDLNNLKRSVRQPSRIKKQQITSRLIIFFFFLLAYPNIMTRQI